MDARAGAITEATDLGGDLLGLALPPYVATAERDAKGRSESASKVVQIPDGTRGARRVKATS